MEHQIEIRHVDYVPNKKYYFKELEEDATNKFIVTLARNKPITIKPNEKDKKLTEITILVQGNAGKIDSKFQKFENGLAILENSKMSKTGRSKELNKGENKSKFHYEPLKDVDESIENSIKDMEDKILRLSESYTRMKNDKEAYFKSVSTRTRDFSIFEAAIPNNISKNHQNQQVYASPRASYLKVELSCQNGHSNQAIPVKHCLCDRCQTVGVVLDSQKRIMEEHGPPPDIFESNSRFHRSAVPNWSNIHGPGPVFEIKQSDKDNREARYLRRQKNAMLIQDIHDRIGAIEKRLSRYEKRFLHRSIFITVMRRLLQSKSRQKQFSCLNEVALQACNSSDDEKTKSTKCDNVKESSHVGHRRESIFINQVQISEEKIMSTESNCSGFSVSSSCLSFIEGVCSSDPRKRLSTLQEYFEMYIKEDNLTNDYKLIIKEIRRIKKQIRRLNKIAHQNSIKVDNTINVNDSNTEKNEDRKYVEYEPVAKQKTIEPLIVMNAEEEIITPEIDIPQIQNGDLKNSDEEKKITTENEIITILNASLDTEPSEPEEVFDRSVNETVQNKFYSKPRQNIKSSIPIKIHYSIPSLLSSTNPEVKIKKNTVPTFSPCKSIISRSSIDVKKDNSIIKHHMKPIISQTKQMEFHENFKANNSSVDENKIIANKRFTKRSDFMNKWVQDTSNFVKKRMVKDRGTARRYQLPFYSSATISANQKPMEKRRTDQAQNSNIFKYTCNKIGKIENAADGTKAIILQLRTQNKNDKGNRENTYHKDAQLQLSLKELENILNKVKSSLVSDVDENAQSVDKPDSEILRCKDDIETVVISENI